MDDVVLLSNTALGLQAMIKIVENFGKENEIKFNVSKTNIVVFHNKRIYKKKGLNSLNCDDKLLFRLDGQLIPVVTRIKYLGTVLDKHLLNSPLITDKIKGQAARVESLNRIGFSSKSLGPLIKAFYFRTYIRPYLYYGLNALKLSANDIRRIKACEGNLIKNAVGLPTELRSTELFFTLGIETTQLLLDRDKVGLMLRLLSNQYTKKVIIALLASSGKISIKDSYIYEILNIFQLQEVSIENLRN